MIALLRVQETQQRKNSLGHDAPDARWAGEFTRSLRLLDMNACAVGCLLTWCVFGAFVWGSAGDLCRMPLLFREGQA